MSDVVWSINIMLALLLVGVGVSIYWIFKYDDWNPNPVVDSEYSATDGEGDSHSGRSDSENERMGIGTEEDTSR